MREVRVQAHGLLRLLGAASIHLVNALQQLSMRADPEHQAVRDTLTDTATQDQKPIPSGLVRATESSI